MENSCILLREAAHKPDPNGAPDPPPTTPGNQASHFVLMMDRGNLFL